MPFKVLLHPVSLHYIFHSFCSWVGSFLITIQLLCHSVFTYSQVLLTDYRPLLSLFLLSVFSLSVMPDSLRPHGLQHARHPCPLPSPGACSNSCPLCQWCHPTISSSVVPFSSCFQSFPAWGSFPMSQPFTSGGQSIEASASASVLPVNIRVDSFRSGWFDLLDVQGTQKSLLQHHNSKHIIFFFSSQPSLCPILTYIYHYWKKKIAMIR